MSNQNMVHKVIIAIWDSMKQSKILILQLMYFFQALGLQTGSNPPVWVFGNAIQFTLEHEQVKKLTVADSPYTLIADISTISYSYEGIKFSNINNNNNNNNTLLNL